MSSESADFLFWTTEDLFLDQISLKYYNEDGADVAS